MPAEIALHNQSCQAAPYFYNPNRSDPNSPKSQFGIYVMWDIVGSKIRQLSAGAWPVTVVIDNSFRPNPANIVK